MGIDYTINGYALPQGVVVNAEGPEEAMQKYMDSEDYNDHAWELNVIQGDNASTGFKVMEVQILCDIAYQLEDTVSGLAPGWAIAARPITKLFGNDLDEAETDTEKIVLKANLEIVRNRVIDTVNRLNDPIDDAVLQAFFIADEAKRKLSKLIDEMRDIIDMPDITDVGRED